jgi:hypothetical protein
MRTGIVTLVLLSALPLSGATLGDEQPLAPPARVPAAFQQYQPVIASNGRGFFAVWRDQRIAWRPGVPHVPEELRGAHLDSEGHPVEPAGILLATGSDLLAAVAPAGDDYVVATLSPFGLSIVRVKDDGTVGPPVTVRIDSSRPDNYTNLPAGLATDGTTFCVLRLKSSGSGASALIFDADGRVLRTITFSDIERYENVISTRYGYVLSGIRYRCDGVHACTTDVVVTKIDAGGGGIVNSLTIDSSLPTASTTTATAIAGDRLLVGYLWENQSGRRMQYMMVDAVSFDPRSPQQTADYTSKISSVGGHVPSAGSDGRQFLLGWPAERESDQMNSALAVRIAADGTMRDAVPFALTGETIFPAFASAQSDLRAVVLTTEALTPGAMPDVVAHTAPSYDTIDSAERSSITFSCPAQSDPALAAADNRVIAVWREGDTSSAIMGSLDGRSIEIASRDANNKVSPDVAVLGQVFLVVWEQSATQWGPWRIFARRVAADGTLLDAEPLLLEDLSQISLRRRNVSVTTDGAQFLVVWSAGQEVHGVRILPSGTLLDRTPIVISHDTTSGYHERQFPRALWTGDQFLVVWSDNNVDPIRQFPPPAVVKVRLAHVTSSGAVLETADSATLSSMPGYSDPLLRIARGDDRVLVVWPVQPCLMSLALDLNGRPLADAPEPLTCNRSWDSGLDVIWHRGAFTVFWDVDQRLYAVRLTVPRATTAIGEAWSPAAVALPNGDAFVAYARFATEPVRGSVPSLFGRMYVVPPPRMRGVRH